MEAEETEVVPMLDLAASRFDENRRSLPVTRVTRLAEVRGRFPFPLPLLANARRVASIKRSADKEEGPKGKKRTGPPSREAVLASCTRRVFSTSRENHVAIVKSELPHIRARARPGFSLQRFDAMDVRSDFYRLHAEDFFSFNQRSACASTGERLARRLR